MTDKSKKGRICKRKNKFLRKVLTNLKKVYYNEKN